MKDSTRQALNRHTLFEGLADEVARVREMLATSAATSLEDLEAGYRREAENALVAAAASVRP